MAIHDEPLALIICLLKIKNILPALAHTLHDDIAIGMLFLLFFILRMCMPCHNELVFNVAGYLIEERCRRPEITASPRGEYSK